MAEILEFMIAPFAACMVLVAIHSYLGIHVIAREVIFVDLSLAQIAALGSIIALMVDVTPDSVLDYVFPLAFTVMGAFIFAVTRPHSTTRLVPQEAIIGIVYVVASAAAMLLADMVPTGGEAIRAALVGTLLWVDWPTIIRLAVVYALIAVFHWFFRERFLTISLNEPEAESRGWNIRWWDFLFYVSFGVVITLAVPVAGVLLVFTFLVVPAVVAFLFTKRTGLLLGISWGFAVVASAAGLVLSFAYDLPTGPLIVCVFGFLLLVAGAVKKFTPGLQAN